MGENHFQLLTDLDPLGIQLAEAASHPEVVQGRSLHQFIFRVVEITPDCRPLDHNPGVAGAKDHPGSFHSVLIRNLSDFLLAQAEHQKLVPGQLHLQLALGFLILGIDQFLAGDGIGLGERGLDLERFSCRGHAG